MKASKTLAFVLFAILSAYVSGQECDVEGSGSGGECNAPNAVDEKCPDRGHITRCAGAFMDTNSTFPVQQQQHY
jgi:hypothetical protein